MRGLRIRRAGLMVERLSRCAPTLSPSNSRRHIGYARTFPTTFRVYLLHSWRFGANEVVSLSTGRSVQISPALTVPLSTGDRRALLTSKLAISTLEAPHTKAGEKGAS